MIDIAGMLSEKKSALRELQEDIRSLERVQHMSPSNAGEEPRISINIAELRKMRTQQEALDHIASMNNGRVVVNEAKHVLIQAGFINGQHKYAYGHIYNKLKNDDRYDIVDVGVFEKK